MPVNMESMPETEIISERVFNYPGDFVYKAWTDPAHLKNWWGPAGFTNTFHEFDFRVGGRWKFTMHGPDKGHYENEVEFTRIEPSSLLEWKRHSKPLFNVLVTFTPQPVNQTRLLFRMIFATAEECNKVKRFAIDKNEENFDRLEAELASMNL